MWRYTSQINYRVDESDQSPLTNSNTSLIKCLPNKLVPQIPSWSYSLHSQLGYAQAADGVPVQSSTYHVVASIEVPVKDFKIVDLNISYQFENSDESVDSDNQDASQSISKSKNIKKMNDDDLFVLVKQQLRDNVKSRCSKDGITWQEIENFELGYIKYLYERLRHQDVEEIIKEVSTQFKGQVHPVKRYLNDQFFEVQRLLSVEKTQKQQITDPNTKLQAQFMLAFFQANPQVVSAFPLIEQLQPSVQLQKIQTLMPQEQFSTLVKRMEDYIKAHQ
ncbi:hypothetical protein SS50377_20148 [Spironucleus salmonicida]|uniref:Uncharacterized protein n=1 Tax=Spironucleus salmonicida TaxID=348837 RepID=V6LLW7_9EUKA|nr:hypothetical protein SS50377_20148 [Spironucleus salmonicida]|eukprot:EST45203.1 Hypothetical protein SS50377_14775 [Spironucleus salmonicida]